MKYILMSLIGYLSGSVMWAYLIPRIFLDMDICELSEDHNPGSVNVFLNAGVKWGILVLCCELAKGFLPVMLAKKWLDTFNVRFTFVLAAPVLGHAFPVFFPKKGGKAIAVSFGVLLGLTPYWGAVVMLAFFYVFFSAILVITPHIYRSIVTYFCFGVTCLWEVTNPGIKLGCVAIALIVIGKHCVKYHGEKIKVLFLGHDRAQKGNEQKIQM